MCCLFGLIDTRQQYSGAEKARMLHALATAAEARGTDAAGYACNGSGGLIVRKSPVPGHKLRFAVLDDTVTVMGHARMTTQGDARRNRNNHPFAGSIKGARFAFAHNGVIYNDHELRERFALPHTKIETDSYVAVQLLETQEALNFDALRFAAEQLEGSFTFTALDEQNALYIVKGDNPLSLIRFPKTGLADKLEKYLNSPFVDLTIQESKADNNGEYVCSTAGEED
ncbi:MAG: class II glutamine amidotransferase [Oscillospiraceae bacterium]|nr:class II glutamine amidotransferase [Oscillospiraceae bacterium]